MSRITILIIGTNYPDNIYLESLKSEDKYLGFIYLLKDGQIHNLLISTKAIFDSEVECIGKLKELCNDCLNFLENENEN